MGTRALPKPFTQARSCLELVLPLLQCPLIILILRLPPLPAEQRVKVRTTCIHYMSRVSLKQT